MTGTGGPIRDYANGDPLAGGGNFYFTSNATPARARTSPALASFPKTLMFLPGRPET